ncbi:flagellar assembly protein H [Escherichia coli]|uniref:Flagellar assembly protein H n=1 Tax=Escherichia coli TaxID=562 RepID=A0A377BMZ5_ECOLX|nr:flagellar assembly protein H [Escherichia coli]
MSQRAAIFCATISPTVSGASVAGGKRQKAILLIVRRLAETGRDGNWQRRGYLCLIICRGNLDAGRSRATTGRVCAHVEPEETIIEEAEPSLEQQLAQLQMQAHEQGYQAGLPKVASKVMSRAIRKDWPGAGARSGRGEVSTSANSCPDAATGQRISNYP